MSSTARPCSGADPGSDRGRRVRQPARPALRRLHDRRSRRRPRGGAAALGLGQDLLLRRLLRDPVRPGLRGALSRARCAALVLDSAYPGDDPYYRTLLPAGLQRAADRLPAARRPARATRSPASPASSAASTPPGARPRACSTSSSQAGTLAPRSYLSLDEADRRFLAGEPRRLNGLIAPGPAGHGELARILLRPGDRGRVQRLPAALGPARRDRRADPPALGRGDAAAAGPLRPVRPPRVPALLGRPPDQLPDLAGAAAGRPRAAGPGRLAGADQLPDPDPRRPGRRHHLGGGGAAGAAPLSRARASTWCRTAATPRASTSPSARRRWARSGTSSPRTSAGYGRYFSACSFASSMPFSAWALPSSMPFSACLVPSSMPFLALPLLSSICFLASSRPFLASSVPSSRPSSAFLTPSSTSSLAVAVLSVLLSSLLPQPDQTAPPATIARSGEHRAQRAQLGTT